MIGTLGKAPTNKRSHEFEWTALCTAMVVVLWLTTDSLPIEVRVPVASVRLCLTMAHGSVAVGGDRWDGVVPLGAPPPIALPGKVDRIGIVPVGTFGLVTNGRGALAALPCWVLVLVGVTLTGLAAHRQNRRRFNPVSPRCEVCGFDLCTHPERCPECGHENPDPERAHPRSPAPAPFGHRLDTLLGTLRRTSGTSTRISRRR